MHALPAWQVEAFLSFLLLMRTWEVEVSLHDVPEWKQRVWTRIPSDTFNVSVLNSQHHESMLSMSVVLLKISHMLCNKSRLESAFFQQNMLATNPKVEMLWKSWSPIRWLLQPIKIFRIFQRQCVSIRIKLQKLMYQFDLPRLSLVCSVAWRVLFLFFWESGWTTLATLLGQWPTDPKCAGSGSL